MVLVCGNSSLPKPHPLLQSYSTTALLAQPTASLVVIHPMYTRYLILPPNAIGSRSRVVRFSKGRQSILYVALLWSAMDWAFAEGGSMISIELTCLHYSTYVPVIVMGHLHYLPPPPPPPPLFPPVYTPHTQHTHGLCRLP